MAFKLNLLENLLFDFSRPIEQSITLKKPHIVGFIGTIFKARWILLDFIFKTGSIQICFIN